MLRLDLVSPRLQMHTASLAQDVDTQGGFWHKRGFRPCAQGREDKQQQFAQKALALLRIASGAEGFLRHREAVAKQGGQ
eukprot:623344-Pleurochrysis_carterae.AAC.10